MEFEDLWPGWSLVNDDFFEKPMPVSASAPLDIYLI